MHIHRYCLLSPERNVATAVTFTSACKLPPLHGHPLLKGLDYLALQCVMTRPDHDYTFTWLGEALSVQRVK